MGRRVAWTVHSLAGWPPLHTNKTNKHRHVGRKERRAPQTVYPSAKLKPKIQCLVSLAFWVPHLPCGHLTHNKRERIASRGPLTVGQWTRECAHKTLSLTRLALALTPTHTGKYMDDLLINIRCIGICEMWREGDGYGHEYYERGQVSVPALPPGRRKKYTKWNEMIIKIKKVEKMRKKEYI